MQNQGAQAGGGQNITQVVMHPDDLARLLRDMNARGGKKRPTVLEQADPDAWYVWRQNFNVTVLINGWDDARARMEAFTAMEGDARRAVSEVRWDGYATLERLLDAYEARFVPEAASSWAQADFDTATQLPSESALQWHTRLRTMFLRAYPGEAAETSAKLIRRYCVGVQDEEVRVRATHAHPRTFTDALNQVQNIVADTLLLKQQATVQAALKARPRPNYFNFKGRLNALDEAPAETEESLNQLQGAGRSGGGAPRGSCFLCEQPGHFQRECPILLKYGEKIQKLQKKKGGKGKKGKNTSSVNQMSETQTGSGAEN